MCVFLVHNFLRNMAHVSLWSDVEESQRENSAPEYSDLDDCSLLIESDTESDTQTHAAGVHSYLLDTGLPGFVLQLPENVYHQTNVQPFDEFFDEEHLDLGDLQFTRLLARTCGATADADTDAQDAEDTDAEDTDAEADTDADEAGPPAKRARKHPGFYNEELVQINHNVLEHRSRAPDVQVAYHAAELYCANPDAFAELCQTLPPYDETVRSHRRNRV